MNHVLHLIDDLDFGGAQQVVMDIACSMKPKGFIPLVCSLQPGPLVETLRQSGIETIVIQKRRSYDISLVVELIKIIRRRKINLVHSHLLVSYIYGWMAARLSRVPMVMTLHGISFINLRRGNRVFRFLGNRSECVVAVSEDLKDSVVEETGINEGRLKTVYNGVDLAKFSYKRDSLKKELGLSPKDLVVGSVGTLRSVKGFEYLLKSASLVREIVPEAKFVIVGDGPLRGDLEKNVRDLNLEGSVFLLGYRRDIAWILPGFDIFVLSSLTEGISISILEAMAASKPVVATLVGGNPEVVENGVTGVLVPSKDPESLAQAITQLLKSREKRERLGEAGRRRVEERFSLEAMARGYKEIYLDIIKNERGSKKDVWS